ncbi:MAG TPA: alkaline phosphatase family protein [Candidatus Hypogeohydataceae bacterium YC41]
MKRFYLSVVIFLVLCNLFSCIGTSTRQESASSPGAVAQGTIKVPGNKQWTNTGIAVEADQYIHIAAEGKVEKYGWSYVGRNYDYEVGPEGTYNYDEKVKEKNFPLPAAEAGPAPCYALIGKVGEEGEPFLVGRNSVIKSIQTGTLYFGINDFDASDNKGHFQAKVELFKELPKELLTWDTRGVIETVPAPTGQPTPTIKDARVIIFYLDGVRYDVMKEMAFKGYLPNIKKYFFDNGVDVVNSFTVFPSTTFTSSACFLTGCFNDLTGIKSDVFLDRYFVRVKHFFTPYGPLSSARRFEPGWVGDLVDPVHRSVPLKAIYDYMNDSEISYANSALPVLYEHPPLFYQDMLDNKVRYLGIHEVRHKFDQINTGYALEEVIKRKNRVMYVWLPGVDEQCHESARGQFGAARKKLYLIDRYIGDMIGKLKQTGVFDKTYLVLYADHGHVGGKDFINQSFDIINDFFYKSIKDVDGDGVLDADSGLGFNVRYVEHDEALHREHIDKPKEDFVAVANMGYGAAVIYLPYKSKYSRNWNKLNSYYDLTNYEIYPGKKPVNILDKVLQVDLSQENKFPGVVSSRPIDMVIARVAENTVYIKNSKGQEALIERRSTDQGKRSFEYRYQVITGFQQDEQGNNTFQEPAEGAEDPFGYFTSPGFVMYVKDSIQWCKEFHFSQEWLEATKNTDYPDAVVCMAHFGVWDRSIKNLEERYAPDFAVTPKKGWSFQTDARLATDHGYPLYESMRIPILIAGPTIKKGVILTEPHRIVDIVPTVMDIVGAKYDPDKMDGKGIKNIYEGVVEGKPHEELVQFYTDRGLSVERELPPVEMGYTGHNIDNAYDTHFLIADAASVMGQRAVRITDDIMDLAIPGKPVRPLNTSFDLVEDTYYKIPDNVFTKRFAQLLGALRIRQFSVADGLSMIVFGNFYTEGNLLRAQLVIDWGQDVLGDINKLLGAPIYHFEKGLIPGTKYVNRYAIDGPQFVVERIRRVAVESITRTFYRGVFYAEDGVSATGNAMRTKTWQTPEIETPLTPAEGTVLGMEKK